ncbi:hypothetical protein M3Y95_01267400 [Aphelenchoides besseyi]|nr:hypothetical protein M3Y95_01267400 [Aphelenchoides besseyi]
MIDSAKYDTYALPHGVRPKFASPALVPLIADSTLTKSRPTSVEPPNYSISGTESIAPSLELKLRYAFNTLLLICASAIFFAFMSLNRIDSLERIAVNISNLPKNHVTRIVWEISMTVSLATMLSSIATFFVGTLQMFFALKIAKSNPGSILLALRFLKNGKLIRLPTFFVYFLTTLLFLISLVVSLIVMPTSLSLIPRSIACAIAISLSLFCTAASLHSLHTLFRLDDPSRTDQLNPTALAFAQHYSTLV